MSRSGSLFRQGGHRAWLGTSAALGWAVLASTVMSFPAPMQVIPDGSLAYTLVADATARMRSCR